MISARARQASAVAVVTLLAIACRLAVLDQPMRFDESVSWAYYVGRPWATIVGTYHQPNNHVLYSLMAKAAAAPFSYAPWALRLPAVLAGICIVPLTYAVGRRFTDEQSALLASALCVGATPLVFYSTNARGYTVIVAAFLVLLLVAHALRERATIAGWAAFAIVAAAGLYTIPVMLYPLAVVAAWLALSARSLPVRERILFSIALLSACVAAALIAALLYWPIIRSAGVGALTGNRFVRPSPWPVFVAALPRMFVSTLVSWASPLPIWGAPLLAAFALAGTRSAAAARRFSLGWAVAIGCAALLVVTHRSPFVRVWLFLLPLFLIAVARGTVRVLDRVGVDRAATIQLIACGVAAASFIAALLTHSVERSDETGAFRSAREVTAALAPLLRRGDRVLAPLPVIGPLLYYFPRAGADTTMLTVSLDSSQRAFLVLDAHQQQTLSWAIGRHILDTTVFGPPRLMSRYPDGELWQAERRFR